MLENIRTDWVPSGESNCWLTGRFLVGDYHDRAVIARVVRGAVTVRVPIKHAREVILTPHHRAVKRLTICVNTLQ